MTVKEHLQKLHEDSVGHHQAAAKGHRALAKLFKSEGALESAADIAAAHEDLANCHDSMASNHSAMLKGVVDEMGKAAGDSLVPDRVSAIITSFPNITAVPRNGQRPLDRTVAPEFEKLVAIEEN